MENQENNTISIFDYTQESDLDKIVDFQKVDWRKLYHNHANRKNEGGLIPLIMIKALVARIEFLENALNNLPAEKVNIEKTDNIDGCRLYSYQELTPMTVPALNKICERLKIDIGDKKSETLKNIMFYQNRLLKNLLEYNPAK